MKKLLMIGCAVFMLAIVVYGQTAGPQSTNPSATSVSSQRALLDQYCVSCHNQKQKNAGLALDKLDLERVGENAGRITHRNYTSFSPTYCESACGYYEEVMKMHGAARHAVDHPKCLGRGAQECIFELRWS